MDVAPLTDWLTVASEIARPPSPALVAAVAAEDRDRHERLASAACSIRHALDCERRGCVYRQFLSEAANAADGAGYVGVARWIDEILECGGSERELGVALQAVEALGRGPA
ncbi:MAG TPA: hypothetical protein VFW46_15645 [Stellaceae bacterium]|nr:hypothetical protein [Stellaceae bacterium]